MASDMERALDEILSGVNALMQQAPKSNAKPATVSAHRASFNAFDTIPVSPEQWASLLGLLARMESDATNGVSAVAGRLTNQLLLARCVCADDLSDQSDGVMVSPLIYPVFQALHGIGARWVSADADSLLWQMEGVDIAKAQSALKKFSSVLCPVQTSDGLHWRLPRIPERSALDWIAADDLTSSSQLISAEQVAVIDQDKRGKKPTTIIWSGPSAFVPDWWCGSAFHEGKWRPVVHWAAAEFTKT
jgi:hypothetical protein